MPHILDEIVHAKRAEVTRNRINTPPEVVRECLVPATRDFVGALRNGKKALVPHLIAELKRKSPSRGLIRPDFDFENILETYQMYAAACSVLTDYPYFGGALEDLDTADRETTIPLLRKDFIIDEYQILEARQFGADAILLIAAILADEEIRHFSAVAAEYGMDALVETHTADEVKRAVQLNCPIIGINNRNLDTLKIDLTTTHELVTLIPADRIIVAESGIDTAADVEKLIGKVDAMLVGTSILKADNIIAKLRELTRT